MRKRKQTTKVTKLWFRHETPENKTLPLNTLNRDFYCPVCKKFARVIYDPSNDPALSLPQPRIVSLREKLPEAQRIAIQQEEARIFKLRKEIGLTVECGCGIREHMPLNQKYEGEREIERGITYNEETGTVSFYKLGMEYFINKRSKNKSVLGTGTVNRLSINTRTGASYHYTCFVGDHAIRRLDWINSDRGCYYFQPSNDSESLVIFLNTVLEKLELPVTVKKVSGPYDTSYGFECFNETFVVSKDTAIRLITELAVSPNLYISYDTYTGKASFRDIAMINRLEDGEYFQWHYWRTSEFKKLQPRRLMDNEEYISMLCEKLHVPSSPRMKKLYRQDPVLTSTAQFYLKAGFKEPDNLYSLVRHGREAFFSYSCRKKNKLFLKAFINSCGETTACNKLVAHFTGNGNSNENRMYFEDTIRMWDEFRRADMSISFTGTLHEIHDKAALQVNKLRYEDIAIPYTAEELARQGKYGRYTINAAESTLVLHNIGTLMHICVGGYWQTALTKMTTIYYMVDSNGRYQACIEVRNNKLAQAKGYCNTSLKGDVAKAVKDWIEDNKIPASCCFDYENICENLKCFNSETVA